MNDVNGRIRERIEAFVTEISGLIRQAALDSVAEALGGAGGAPLGGGVRFTLDADARRSGKRSREEIDSTTSLVMSFVEAHPGQGVEQIAQALGADTRGLTLPIRKLVAAGKLTTEGQKRATKYFPAVAEARAGSTASKPRGGKGRAARTRRSRA